MAPSRSLPEGAGGSRESSGWPIDETRGFVQDVRDHPWIEPLDAYLRLRQAGRKPVLLDGLGLHPEARYAHVAFTPVHELKVEAPFCVDASPSGSTETRGNILGHMARVIEDTKFPGHQEEAPFTGGWVGFLSYGFSRVLEPSLPPRKGPPGVPDALLHLYLDCLVLDRRTRTARLYCADLSGLAAATRRADQVNADLGRDAVRPRPPPQQRRTWETSLSQDQFMVAVGGLRRLIHDGDLFQANLATRFSAPCDADPAALFASLQEANPSPYMALLEQPGFAVVSASPEQLVAVDARTGMVRSRPIAGTRKRGATPDADEAMERDLRSDEKEQAEHTMLVDLVRNDVAKVAAPGSVRVPERMSVERYRHVMHLVSRVEGRLLPGRDAWDALLALFPGGTVTGAPKVRACERLQQAEPVSRGIYTGSLGYLSWSGNAHWNILIRTLLVADGQATVFAGSGIVADSDPEREWKEADRKARALLDAAEGHGGTGMADRLGEVTTHAAWSPSVPSGSAGKGRRVLLIDNYDSFVHNLADYCAALGAEVRVVRNDADWRAELAGFKPTHLVLSPGPGWPGAAGCTVEVAREATGRLPILGVCLGHQSIGQAHGGIVEVHPGGPVHGKAAEVRHDGQGLFKGLPSPLRMARYHSLVVRDGTLGPEWIVDARLADGTIMALRHRFAPTFGLQGHPESICTDRGLELVANFLEIA
ncbi:MAG TPA: chorismate-binding protein [Candidatus Thermoplasmatota archaeon]|nr:chorismate-binding protein [Candidatus Thermoplasmatota archaeon]